MSPLLEIEDKLFVHVRWVLISRFAGHTNLEGDFTFDRTASNLAFLIRNSGTHIFDPARVDILDVRTYGKSGYHDGYRVAVIAHDGPGKNRVVLDNQITEREAGWTEFFIPFEEFEMEVEDEMRAALDRSIAVSKGGKNDVENGSNTPVERPKQ